MLLNDYDPNGDVIVITSDTGINSNVGRVDLINNRQELQITLAPTASGVLSFRLHDQRWPRRLIRRDRAVTVQGPGDNQAPRQVRTSKTTVVTGGRVTTQVLGDWEDPDGDPMYVTNASVDSPDAVTLHTGRHTGLSRTAARPAGVKT